jgi:hypothetical protein
MEWRANLPMPNDGPGDEPPALRGEDPSCPEPFQTLGAVAHEIVDAIAKAQGWAHDHA